MTRMGGMGAVGCKPHGQGWERWEWLVGGVGVGAVGGTRRNSEGLGEGERIKEREGGEIWW